MCKCIQIVNAQLVPYNGLVETNWLSNPARAMVSICKLVSKINKTPPVMEATFCPFCGEKYPEKKGDLARELAIT
jgi:hypothetical protein